MGDAVMNAWAFTSRMSVERAVHGQGRVQKRWSCPVSYVFQATLIETMRQYAMLAAEEHLNPGGGNDEATQREHLQAETDAELAEEAICAWALDDIDSNALRTAFADLRRQLCA